MDFLGIGPLEFLLILVVALIVFGPHRLPEIGRTIGKTIYELRKVSSEFTAEINREIESASTPIQATLDEVKSFTSELRGAVPATENSLEPESSTPPAESLQTETTDSLSPSTPADQELSGATPPDAAAIPTPKRRRGGRKPKAEQPGLAPVEGEAAAEPTPFVRASAESAPMETDGNTASSRRARRRRGQHAIESAPTSSLNGTPIEAATLSLGESTSVA